METALMQKRRAGYHHDQRLGRGDGWLSEVLRILTGCNQNREWLWKYHRFQSRGASISAKKSVVLVVLFLSIRRLKSNYHAIEIGGIRSQI